MKITIPIIELDDDVEFEGEVTHYQPAEKPGSVNPGCGEEFEFKITWDQESYSKRENEIIEKHLGQVHDELCKAIKKFRQ